MRLLAATVLALLALAAPAAAKPCVRDGERAVARGDRVVMVKRTTDSAPRYLACVRADASRRPIDTGWFTEAEHALFTVAGWHLAYWRAEYEEGQLVFNDVVVADARRPWGTTITTPFGDAPVRAIDLDRHGRVAVATDVTVQLLGGERRRLLDDAVPGSLSDLALRRGVVRWRHAGILRQAPVEVPGACRPPQAVEIVQQTSRAVLGTRWIGPRLNLDTRTELCRFDGAGWKTLGEWGATLVGDVVGVRHLLPDGFTWRLEALRLADLEPIQPPVVLPVPLHGWAVTPGGSIVVSRDPAQITVHHPDGRTTDLPADPPVGWDGLAVDEAAGAIVWSANGRHGSISIPE